MWEAVARLCKFSVWWSSLLLMGVGGREGNAVDLVLHQLDWYPVCWVMECVGGVSLKEVSCFWSSTCGSYFQWPESVLLYKVTEGVRTVCVPQLSPVKWAPGTLSANERPLWVMSWYKEALQPYSVPLTMPSIAAPLHEQLHTFPHQFPLPSFIHPHFYTTPP